MIIGVGSPAQRGQPNGDIRQTLVGIGQNRVHLMNRRSQPDNLISKVPGLLVAADRLRRDANPRDGTRLSVYQALISEEANSS